MRSLLALLGAAVLFSTGGVALADPWKDESGKGRSRGGYHDDHRGEFERKRGERKQKFRIGGCKVEREWDRDGRYEEKVECKGRRGRLPASVDNLLRMYRPVPPSRYGERDWRNGGVENRSRDRAGGLVPPNWRLQQPPDPDWRGTRYASPDGTASVSFYAVPASGAASEYMKAFAFVEGEEMTHLRADRDRIAVAGLKDDRAFYRRATLACGGTRWLHVAFEYPAEAKRELSDHVMHVERMLDGRQKDEACQSEMSSQ